MKTEFKSIVDLPIGIVTFAIPIGLLIFSIAQMNWAAVAICLLLSSFLFYIGLCAKYIITADQLVVKFLSTTEIPIDKIKSIKKNTTYLAGAGLSRHRLEINYNTYDTISISPVQQEDFIRQLIKLNPNIVLAS